MKDEIVEIRKDVDSIFEILKEIASEQVKTEKMVQNLSYEMKEFKNEMKEFKNEILDFKTNLEIDRKKEQRDWNKKWGELSNKSGTIVEYIILPAVRPLTENYFNCKINKISNHWRVNRGEIFSEFDVVATNEHFIFLVEVKSTPKKGYVEDFVKNIEKFRFLCPEYNDLKLIPIFASLRFENNIVQLCTENNIYAMAYKEWEYMDLLNFENIKL
jgi:hypothetical protein